MKKTFNLDFLEDKKINVAIDLGKNNLEYICKHINSRCELFSKEGSREFVRRFNSIPENRNKVIKLINLKQNIREFPNSFADLIVIKNIDFNSKEIYRVLKKNGIVLVYFPIAKNFDDGPYLTKIQNYFKEIGYLDIFLYKNQELEDGLFHVLIASK